MNWLNLLGFILMTIGTFIVFLLNYNANELDKARFIKWKKQAKNDGSLNFKIRWSKLGKQIFLAYFINTSVKKENRQLPIDSVAPLRGLPGRANSPDA